jgi:EmrB/QacA subfamily drug resistance transporter
MQSKQGRYPLVEPDSTTQESQFTFSTINAQDAGNMYEESDARAADLMSHSSRESQPVRRAPIFTIVVLALLMSSVDSTIVATALHALQHGLNTSINWASWTITAYAFGVVLMLPVSGKLSERYGRRRVFLGSVAAFTAASLLCGLSDNIYALIALRAVQAAGGAGFTPSATGIIVDHFGDARDRAVGLFGSVFAVGAMIGPVFGGFFVEYWNWRGVFFVNVPIGLVIIVSGLYYIPRDRPRAEKLRQSMDTAGMALLGAGLLAGMLAANALGERGTHAWSPTFAAPLAVAVISLWAFLRHIGRETEPFIAPRFIHGPSFSTINLFNVLYGGVTNGIMALVPLYAIDRYGIGTLDSGTLLVAQGGAAIVLSIAAAMVLRLTGYRPPLYVGGSVMAVGALLLALPPAGGLSPYAWLAGGAFLIGVGSGIVNPASRNAGLMLAPESSSTLAALRTMSRQIGTIVTVSIASAVIADSADPGDVQAWVYVAAAALLVVAMPLVARVPEHRGAW